MLGKIAGAVFLLFVLFAVMWSPLSSGLETMRTDTVTQNFVVTTVGTNDTANVTLSRTLFLEQADKVTTITSNATETPVALSYDAASQKVLVGSLNLATTRVLTVTYKADTSDDVIHSMGPFLGLLLFGGILGAIAWSIFKKKR